MSKNKFAIGDLVTYISDNHPLFFKGYYYKVKDLDEYGWPMFFFHDKVGWPPNWFELVRKEDYTENEIRKKLNEIKTHFGMRVVHITYFSDGSAGLIGDFDKIIAEIGPNKSLHDLFEKAKYLKTSFPPNKLLDDGTVVRLNVKDNINAKMYATIYTEYNDVESPMRKTSEDSTKYKGIVHKWGSNDYGEWDLQGKALKIHYDIDWKATREEGLIDE